MAWSRVAACMNDNRAMPARLSAFVIWALVAAGLVFWGYRLLGAADGACPPTCRPSPRALALRGDLTRLLGAAPAPQSVAPAPVAESSRFRLLGVLAPVAASGAAGQSTAGVALIAVDGKPARAYAVGVAARRRPRCCSRSRAARRRSAPSRGPRASCWNCRRRPRRRPEPCPRQWPAANLRRRRSRRRLRRVPAAGDVPRRCRLGAPGAASPRRSVQRRAAQAHARRRGDGADVDELERHAPGAGRPASARPAQPRSEPTSGARIRLAPEVVSGPISPGRLGPGSSPSATSVSSAAALRTSG